MPDLPTVTVTTGQANFLIGEFADPADPGNTAVAVANYRAWLTVQVITFVRERRAKVIRERHAADLNEAIAALDVNLPPVPALPEHLR